MGLFDSLTCHESAPSEPSAAVLTGSEPASVRASTPPPPLCADTLLAFSVYPGHQRPAAAPSTVPSPTTCEYLEGQPVLPSMTQPGITLEQLYII